MVLVDVSRNGSYIDQLSVYVRGKNWDSIKSKAIAAYFTRHQHMMKLKDVLEMRIIQIIPIDDAKASQNGQSRTQKTAVKRRSSHTLRQKPPRSH